MVVARARAYSSADSPIITGEPDTIEEIVAVPDVAIEGLLAAMAAL
jgi:hypothetical protein